MTIQSPKRPIRSYVRRAGRITRAQQQALDELWPQYGIDFTQSELDLDAIFGRAAPRVMEIGFGNGEALVEIARNETGTDFLGIEVHEPGIGHLLILLSRQQLTNVRVIRHDAVEVLHYQIPDKSLTGVNIFFPDPWPKKRHHKRRLIQPDFIEMLATKLAPGGLLQIATDWDDYAEGIRCAANASRYFENLSPNGGYAAAPMSRPSSKFEQRGLELGHPVRDLIYKRNQQPVRSD